MLWHASCGLSLLLKSMHSSREAFSSLHTQQGFTFAAASPGGLRSVDMLVAVGGVLDEAEIAVEDILGEAEIEEAFRYA